MDKTPKIFFDYNATTPLREKAKHAMLEVMSEPLNPSSIHSFGRKGKAILTEARNKIAKYAGAEGGQAIIFTSCGTESNNMALQCLPKVKNIIVSSIEHISILKAANKPSIVSVDKNGKINSEHLQEIINSFNGEPFLASIILANNETGIIQDIKKISEIVFSNKGYLHTDASQALGKIPFNFNDLGADMATISAHKLGGPKGVAALIVKNGLPIEPFIKGGGQEKFLRAGTENLSGIVGFAAAIEESVLNLEKYTSHVSTLKQYLENGIREICSNVVFFGHRSSVVSHQKAEDRRLMTDDYLPNTINFSIPNHSAETMLINFDLAGIAVSSGSACSSGRVNVSHVLQAMNVSDSLAKCAIRISLGWNNTKQEAEKFLEVLRKIVQ